MTDNGIQLSKAGDTLSGNRLKYLSPHTDTALHISGISFFRAKWNRAATTVNKLSYCGETARRSVLFAKLI